MILKINLTIKLILNIRMKTLNLIINSVNYISQNYDNNKMLNDII